MNKGNYIYLQPALRGLSHEELSRIATEMAFALASIAKGSCQEELACHVAAAALGNTCVLAIQRLINHEG